MSGYSALQREVLSLRSRPFDRSAYLRVVDRAERDSAALYQALLHLAMRSHDLRSRGAALRRAYRFRPSASVLFSIGLTERSRGNWAKALKLFGCGSIAAA